MWSNYSYFILVLDLIFLADIQMDRDFTVNHLVGFFFLWKLSCKTVRLIAQNSKICALKKENSDEFGQ